MTLGKILSRPNVVSSQFAQSDIGLLQNVYVWSSFVGTAAANDTLRPVSNYKQLTLHVSRLSYIQRVGSQTKSILAFRAKKETKAELTWQPVANIRSTTIYLNL